MKVTGVRESLEICTEAGWSAYDLILDEETDERLIKRLGTLGDMTYLMNLKEPFYRIETDSYMIRGLQGKHTLRVAMENGKEEIIEEVKDIINEVISDDAGST